MEITEIVSYFINQDSDTLEVTFRTTDDSENEARVDTISLKEAKDFGYDLITESFDFFSDEDDDTEEYDDEDFLDVDKQIPGQNYVCLSFLSPQNMIEKRELFLLDSFRKEFIELYTKWNENHKQSYELLE
jgi:hypothetical protein